MLSSMSTSFTSTIGTSGKPAENMELTQVPYQKSENEYATPAVQQIPGVVRNTRRRCYAWRMMQESDAHSAKYLDDSIAYLVEDWIWVCEATVGLPTIVSAWNSWCTHYAALTEIGRKAKKILTAHLGTPCTLEFLSSSFTTNTYNDRLDTKIIGSSSRSTWASHFSVAWKVADPTPIKANPMFRST